jgi:hypothetical protein
MIAAFDPSRFKTASTMPLEVLEGAVAIAKADLKPLAFDISDLSNLVALRASGISMQPTFKAGDVLVLDQGVKAFSGDGVYLFEIDGEYAISRLVQHPATGLNIQPDHIGWPRRSVEAEDVTIHGKVLPLWRAGEWCSASAGQQLIAVERLRQIESENWTPEHDDLHEAAALELAALCYRDACDEATSQPVQWPWDSAWWKPKSRQRNLERAGALYQAAADVAERAGEYALRDSLREHVNSCSILIDSILQAQQSEAADGE